MDISRITLLISLALIAFILVALALTKCVFAQPTIAFGMDVIHTWRISEWQPIDVAPGGIKVKKSPALYLEFAYRMPISRRWTFNPYIAATSGDFRENMVGFDFGADIKRWTIALGVNHGQANEIIETDWRYRMRTQWTGKDCVGVAWVHYSNGRALFDFLPHGPDDKANRGYNIIMGVFPLGQCEA